jgi:hypothetical protein
MPITTATVEPFSTAISISRRIVRSVFEWVSWFIASARTVTAMVWVPALPPTPATIGIKRRQRDHLRDRAREQADDRRRHQRRRQIGEQPADAALVTVDHRLVDVAFAGAGQRRMSSPASSEMMWTMSSTVIMPTSRPLGSTTAAEISAYFWKRSATSSWSMSTGISVCSRFMTSEIETTRGVRRIQESCAGADRLVRRIDHEDFPEIGGQVLVLAQIVEHVADGPMLGHRDQLALHQAAGGFLGIGKRFLDRGAIVGIERAEHFALVLRVHVLDDRDGVVGIEFGGDVRHLVRLERVDQILADPVVHLGEHVAVEQVGRSRAPARRGPRRGQLEQIGDVGGVERLDERARAFGVAGIDRVEHRATNSGFSRSSSSSWLSGGGIGILKFGLGHR